MIKPKPSTYIVAKDLKQTGLYKGYGFHTIIEARIWNKENKVGYIYKLIE